MDFERGIWQTSLDGDVNRVKKLLHKGRDPNSRDGSGYTAGTSRFHAILIVISNNNSKQCYFWLLVIDKSQLHLHTGNTCSGPEGVS